MGNLNKKDTWSNIKKNQNKVSKAIGTSKDRIFDVFGKVFSLTWPVLNTILEKLSLIDLDKDYFSQWFQWRVYKIDIDTEQWTKHLLIVKNRVSNSRQIWNRIADEFWFQSLANEILRDNPTIAKHIDVPKIRGIINDVEWNQFLIMDYIESDTLFWYNVRNAIPTIYKAMKNKLWDTINGYIDHYESIIQWTEYGLKKYIIKLMNIFCTFWYDTEFFRKYYPLWHQWDFSWVEDSKRLEEKINRICWKIRKDNAPSKEVEWIQDKKDAAVDLLNLFHEKNIYHNDVTSRNILLWDDGKIYVIDFGSATHAPRKQSDLQKSMSSPSAANYQRTYRNKTLEWDYKLVQMIQDL